MLRRPWARMLLWTAVLGMMVVIFFFSAQPQAESDELTQVVAMPLVDLVASWQEEQGDHVIAFLYLIIGTIMRKIAHFCEYALFGLLLRLLARSYGRDEIRLPIAGGVLYAASDEIHQLFVPGRTGKLTDVLIDAAGVCCGVLLVTWIKHIRRKKHVHDSGAL